MRLTRHDRRANLVREVQRLPGHGHGLLVPVQVAQRDGLADIPASTVGESRIGPGGGSPVGQRRTRSSGPAASGVRRQQHVQTPPMAQLSFASSAAAKAVPAT